MVKVYVEMSEDGQSLNFVSNNSSSVYLNLFRYSISIYANIEPRNIKSEVLLIEKKTFLRLRS